MFCPYTRIVSMYLIIIIFGAVLNNGNINTTKYFLILLAFLFLKTVADIIMHLFEHKKLNIAVNTVGSPHTE